MTLVQNVRVIIRKLFARFHIADGFYPDALVIDDRIAVGITGVIDETGFVSVYRGVDDNVVIDGEQVRVMPVRFVIRVPLICLLRSQPLSGVFDQSRSP